MSKIINEYYPTLTDRERKLLYCKIRQRQKSGFMIHRLLHKETRLLGRVKVRERIRLYRIKSYDPRGEKMYSRLAPWKCVIKTNDIAYLLGICYKYAQQKHKLLKDELGKKYVTVKEFCESVHMDEEYVQCLLNDGEARMLNSSKWQKEIDKINKRHKEEIKNIKENAKKQIEEEAKKSQYFDGKKETPAIKDDKNIKITKSKIRHKSFDDLD